jgi:hypothetical protein
MNENLHELRKQVEDLVVAIEGLGFEMQAMVAIARAYAKHHLGEDPLQDTLYAADEEDCP